MKSLIHKPLSLITKTRIRGLDAFSDRRVPRAEAVEAGCRRPRRLAGSAGGRRGRRVPRAEAVEAGCRRPRRRAAPRRAGSARGRRGRRVPRRWRRGCTLGWTGSRDAGAGLRADGVCAEPPSAGAPPSRRAPSVTADTHNFPQTSLVIFCEKQLPREST